MGLFTTLFGTYSSRELKRIQPVCDKILELDKVYSAYSDEELKGMTQVFKDRLKNGETLDDILPDAFAVCREAGWRVLGQKAFPVQILGGIVLHQGRIAQMKTGEGKTLTSTLPAYLNALSGEGVHIVTVNDYLAKYASELMGKIYNFLGLSVGLIIHDKSPEERKQAYLSDITYGTNNEFGFDYLRDNMVTYKENVVGRGQAFCIVDEVDSILIDEARTPLIISGKGEKSTDLYKMADRFAKTLKMVKVKEVDAKTDEQDKMGADFVVDEKAKTATLTPQGTKKAEAFFNVENLMDVENATLWHHINQAIKANSIMHRDIDYVVKDGEVIIVDEFTGRLMMGRRYNEGLHQAIEAKEGVEVASESKTLATITFQNFFRLYKKLSGMTGTAITEDAEFREIYALDVVEIPTNKPMIRVDHPDAVYKTVNGKYRAIIDAVSQAHEKGQPVLVGTVSIEKSELISSLLKKRGIPHEVLNAKYHEKEAEIVAQAGRLGAVTIATNMAGRGTDIMLGGNAEFMAKAEMRKLGYHELLINDAVSFFETTDAEILKAREVFRDLLNKNKEKIKPEAQKVCDVGGLFIIGTERHESRRIDNQLRGRSGRQGDPGESRFYLSLEDDLMRLFGGERMQMMMNTLGVDEDMPIENAILTNSIESAQKRVEERNFGIRKNVLEYDDVMNTQREVIYSQRQKVLNGEDLRETIIKMIDDSISSLVTEFLPPSADTHDEWNLMGLREYFMGWLLNEDDLVFENAQALEDTSAEEIEELLKEKAHKIYNDREEKYGAEFMRELERAVLLRNVDIRWISHIDDMDELKRGIYLRAYAQKNPVVEYRIEGADMFDEMVENIRRGTAKMILSVQVRENREISREQVAKPTSTSGAGDNSVKKEPIRKDKKIGRNDPCPCGSGKKYKKCCGLNE